MIPKKDTSFKVGQIIKFKKKYIPFEYTGKIIDIQGERIMVALKKCELWIEITETDIVK